MTETSDRVVEDERQAKTLARQLPFASLVEVEGAEHIFTIAIRITLLRAIDAAKATGG